MDDLDKLLYISITGVDIFKLHILNRLGFELTYWVTSKSYHCNLRFNKGLGTNPETNQLQNLYLKTKTLQIKANEVDIKTKILKFFSEQAKLYASNELPIDKTYTNTMHILRQRGKLN